MATSRIELGRWGEGMAGRFLVEEGYQVLATNYRCQYGEVDIVARQGSDLVFVEVRTRQDEKLGAPEESLTNAKVDHLVATCQDYVQKHGMENSEWRIDLVCVYVAPGRKLRRIQHVRHAIER